MRVILFMPRFWGAIRAGRKRQTIRPKARCVPGDALSLRGWCGMPYRSKQQLIRVAECRAVVPVEVGEVSVRLDGAELTSAERERFARDDGFADFAAMREFFAAEHGLPFAGEMIQW